MKPEIIALARTTAEERGLSSALVLALIEQESGGDVWASRYENSFYHRYIAPQVANGGIDLTEARLRAFSFGLCQVMGQVAREFDHEGSLIRLFEAPINIALGCRVLKHHIDRKDGDVRQGLLRYNGGARHAYADEVLAKAKKWSAVG